MKRHAATERLLFHSKRWPFFDSLNSLLAPRTHDDNRAAPNFNQSAVVSGHSLRSVPDTPATLSPDCGFAEAGADAVRLPALISAHASDRARSKGGEHVLHRSLHGCSRARRVRGALSDRHLFIQRHDACAPIARAATPGTPTRGDDADLEPRFLTLSSSYRRAVACVASPSPDAPRLAWSRLRTSPPTTRLATSTPRRSASLTSWRASRPPLPSSETPTPPSRTRTPTT